MNAFSAVILASLVGLLATSSYLPGAVLGLYAPLNRKFLACILAFAAGSLIGALAIDLAYRGALELHQQGFGTGPSWALVGGGFVLGAGIYYLISLFLDQRGAAVRLPSRFFDYAMNRKEKSSSGKIELLARCDLLRHLPPSEIEEILPLVRDRNLKAGETLFRAGDPGEALYLIARGEVEVLADPPSEADEPLQPLSVLGEGQTFGEMALISGQPRTATIRAKEDTDLLEITKEDFERLITRDQQMAQSLQKLSHDRALANLKSGGADPSRWVEIAASSLRHLTRSEEDSLLKKTGNGAGLAIMAGSILDTIPGCLVIGATFTDFSSVSLTLIIGMFLSGIPETAVSSVILRRAGFPPRWVLGLWGLVLIAAMIAAGLGKVLFNGGPLVTVTFNQGLAGGATLAVVAHAMIPEAIHDGRSLVVLPVVAGFVLALYLSLSASFV